MKKSDLNSEEAAPKQIDDRIAALGDWRGEALARMRTLIQEADPEVVEEVKWRGTPVFSHDGIICTGETKGCSDQVHAGGMMSERFTD